MSLALEKHKEFNFPSNKAFMESVWLVGDDLGGLVNLFMEKEIP